MSKDPPADGALQLPYREAATTRFFSLIKQRETGHKIGVVTSDGGYKTVPRMRERQRRAVAV